MFMDYNWHDASFVLRTSYYDHNISEIKYNLLALALLPLVLLIKNIRGGAGDCRGTDDLTATAESRQMPNFGKRITHSTLMGSVS